jgi:hypothetical protein
MNRRAGEVVITFGGDTNQAAQFARSVPDFGSKEYSAATRLLFSGFSVRRIAVPLLERALALEPNYGLAHGYLALCFEVLFVRGGLDPQIAAAAVRHAHAAITHGRVARSTRLVQQ